MRSAASGGVGKARTSRIARPEHRYLAISKSAHRAAGLRRIVCGTRCAVSSNRSLSIASSSRGATALSPARPKRLFGSVGGRPAPVRWRGSGRLQKRSVEHASHRRGPTSDSAILSELARCYCLRTARAQAACQGVDCQLTKTTGLHRTMAKVCKSGGQDGVSRRPRAHAWMMSARPLSLTIANWGRATSSLEEGAMRWCISWVLMCR
jgi:hypothetical protein